MTRPISAQMEANLASSPVVPALFLELEFGGGTIRFWTGLGPKTFNGEMFTGAGSLLSIDRIQETQELKSVTVGFELNGLDSNLIAIAYAEEYQSRPARLWLVTLDAHTMVIDANIQLFQGLMDVMVDEDDGETATLGLTVVNEFTNHSNSKAIRLDHETQLELFPGDLGLEFIADLQDKVVTWGRS